MTTTQIENLTKAAQCADLLVSDIREAHKSFCVDGLESRLLEMLLRPLIANAAAIQNELNALLNAMNDASRQSCR